MLDPSIAFSLVIIGSYATLFHLWRGRGLGEWLLYLLACLFGFGTGEVLALSTGWSFMTVGRVHLVESTLGSWALMFLAWWLRPPYSGRHEITEDAEK
ncbi:MAG: hypothetical protein ACUVV0_03565 [Anaerolineae bacterium]